MTTRHNDLIIGDMHAQVSNLGDTVRLLEFILQQAIDRSPKRVIFLGDMFHTHAVVRQEIIHIYRRYLQEIATVAQVWIISGNHDGISPSNAQINICEATFGELQNVKVVSSTAWDDDYVYVAFMHDNDKFVSVANGFANTQDKILLCHQTFDGACYENGTPIPHGVKGADLNYRAIISGHIHKAQTIGKVTYVGTPRMVTRGEANDSKFIYHISDGKVHTFELAPICTDHLAKRYFSWKYTEDGGVVKVNVDALNAKIGDEIKVTVEGSEEFYEAFTKENVNLVGRVRFVPNIKKKLEGRVSIEESGDIKQAMKKYVLEVADIQPEIREKVWHKVSSLI